MAGADAKSTILELLLNDLEDDWVQYVALGASMESPALLVQALIEGAPVDQRTGAQSTIQKAGALLGKRGHTKEIKNLIRLALQANKTE